MTSTHPNSTPFQILLNFPLYFPPYSPASNNQSHLQTQYFVLNLGIPFKLLTDA